MAMFSMFTYQATLFDMSMIVWIFVLTIIGFIKSPVNNKYILILMILYVLQIVGFLNVKIIDDLSICIGTLIEMVFFSFALGNKLRYLKDEITKSKIQAVEYEKQLLINSRLAVAGKTIENIAHLEKVFEPYISTKENKNGTGLGLYIAKKITYDKLNGKIEVSNTSNGARFDLILPIEE